MGFNFFKTRCGAQAKKQDGKKTAIKAGPPPPPTSHSTSSSTRQSLFPNPLALNPPNRLHFIPRSKGTDETRRFLSGDESAALDLSATIGRAARLSKIAPNLNLSGLGATERVLKTGGADQLAVAELLAAQARAEQRLRALTIRRSRAAFTLMTDESLTVLPSTSFQASVRRAAPELYLNTHGKSRSSFDMILETLAEHNTAASSVGNAPAEAGCDACKACFEKCSTCYAASKASTGCDLCRNNLCKAQAPCSNDKAPRSRHPSPERLALERPGAIGVDVIRPVSICPSLLPEPPAPTTKASGLWHDTKALALLRGPSTDHHEDANDDVVEICEVSAIGVVVTAKVVNVLAAGTKSSAASVFAHVRPLTIRSRLAIPLEKRPVFYSLPAGIPRPDSPTLPAAFPAPLFSI